MILPFVNPQARMILAYILSLFFKFIFWGKGATGVANLTHRKYSEICRKNLLNLYWIVVWTSKIVTELYYTAVPIA